LILSPENKSITYWPKHHTFNPFQDMQDSQV